MNETLKLDVQSKKPIFLRGRINGRSSLKANQQINQDDC